MTNYSQNLEKFIKNLYKSYYTLKSREFVGQPIENYQNLKKRLKTVKNIWKRLKTVGNGWNLLKTFKN